jgi:hypothetical protein
MLEGAFKICVDPYFPPPEGQSLSDVEEIRGSGDWVLVYPRQNMSEERLTEQESERMNQEPEEKGIEETREREVQQRKEGVLDHTAARIRRQQELAVASYSAAERRKCFSQTRSRGAGSSSKARFFLARERAQEEERLRAELQTLGGTAGVTDDRRSQ